MTPGDDPAGTRATVSGRRITGIVFVFHTALAAFVCLRGYVGTQDGPAHLYGAHVLASLSRGPTSPFFGHFRSNLRPQGNSLFSYVALALRNVLSEEQVSSVVLFAALLGMPVAAMLFERALRASSRDPARALPEVSATALACVLSYNYFFYRGFYNFVLGVPLAMLCLTAVLSTGIQGLSRPRRVAALLGALVAGFLAALAHPAATAFLLLALPLAALGAQPFRIASSALVFGELLVFAAASSIRAPNSTPPVFASPAESAWRFLRVLGVTHSWFELLSAGTLLAAVCIGMGRVLRRFPGFRSSPDVLWPGMLGLALTCVYFVVPFEYGGAAGLDERIPLFVALLALPYVPLPGRLAPPLLAGMAAFALYTALSSVSREKRLAEIQHELGSAIPAGSTAYTVSLRVKMGSVSADLGRHALADYARRHDLIAAEAFCSHPAHVLLCEPSVPAGYDAGALEDFEYLDSEGQIAALGDPTSPLRRVFDTMVRSARGLDYLVVLGEPSLDAAFGAHVLRPLGAEPLDTRGEIRVYRLRHSTGAGVAAR